MCCVFYLEKKGLNSHWLTEQKTWNIWSSLSVLTVYTSAAGFFSSSLTIKPICLFQLWAFWSESIRMDSQLSDARSRFENYFLQMCTLAFPSCVLNSLKQLSE